MNPQTATVRSAASEGYLDPAWHRDLLDQLCAIERPSASPGEREAAEWLVAELGQLGVRARIESEPAHGTYWWPLGIAAGAGVLAGIASLHGKRRRGVLLGALAAAAAVDDLPPGGQRRLRRVLPQGTRAQVIAELGPADGERTVVVSAHHDAPRSGLLYSPAIPEILFHRVLKPELVPSTGPPLMWPVVGAPLAVAAGSLFGSTRLIRAGTALSAAVAAVLADIAAHDVVPGANDNGTGVVGLLALARALVEQPLERIRVMLVSTSEEATCDGIAAFADRHFDALPRERTFFLCLESLGSPHLAVLRGEGMIRIRDYPPRSLAMLDALASELGIELRPNLRTRNATDAVVPLAAGYQCGAIVSVTELHQIANYHWPTDVPENVDYGTLRDAIRLAEAAVRRLDERWI